MPKGTDSQLSKIFALLYGKPKIRKTAWALRAAEFGYNVTLFDGDKGGASVRQVSPAARERINIINCYDTDRRPVFAELITRFVLNERIWWDDTDNKYISILESKAKEDHAYFDFKLDRFTSNDVIIIDTIRALVYSIMWQEMDANSKDIMKMQKQDWDLYSFQMNLLNTFCTRLRACKAHVIFISHSEVNEHSEPGKDERGKPIRIPTGEVEEQPLSSSRKHGAAIAGFFDDVLRFELTGENIYITTKPSEDKQAGSRGLHVRDTWDNFQFDRLCEAYGFKANPSLQSEGCVYYPAGTLVERPGLIKKTAVDIKKPTITTNGGNATPGQQPIVPQQSSKLNIPLNPKK